MAASAPASQMVNVLLMQSCTRTPSSRPFQPMRVQRAHSRTACRAALKITAPGVSRRSAAVLLAALPALLFSPAARALIPDDDDEELIEKAKANRKKRLASEKEVETEFKKSGGFAEGEVVVVQRAVNRLARSGEALAAGDLTTMANTVTGAWVSELEKAAAGLSTSEAARESVGAVLQGINQLGENAKSGALEDAKRSFVTSVSALQSWAENAGIAAELKGL